MIASAGSDHTAGADRAIASRGTRSRDSGAGQHDSFGANRRDARPAIATTASYRAPASRAGAKADDGLTRVETAARAGA